MSILVVDDNLNYLRALEESLSAHGIEATTLPDAVSAMSYVENNDVQLAVSDYFMPGMDGASLLAVIKKMRPDCQLILTSTYPLGVHALSGCDVSFVEKSELLSVICKEFRRIRHQEG